jgi:hypothetical protein
MFTRNKPSSLNRPCIVEYVRRRAATKLMSANPRDISLQTLTREVESRFCVRVHKSTLQRFLKKMGLHFAWSKTR